MSIAARRMMRGKVASGGDPYPSLPSQRGALAVGAASYSLPGGALYVDPVNGLNTNSGSISAPLATVAKASQLVTAGGTIVCRGGTYHETFTHSGNACTVINYPGEAVWFDGSVVVTSWTQSGSVWVHSGIPTQFNHSTQYGWSSANPGMLQGDPYAAFSDQVFYDGQLLTQIADATNPTAGQFSVDYGANTITIGNNPAGHEVRVSDLRSLVVATQPISWKGVGVRRYAPDNTGSISAPFYYGGSSGGSLFENVVVRQSAMSGGNFNKPNIAGTFYVAGSTASDFTFTPTTLYIGSDPTGKTVNVTDLHQFLNLGSGYTGLTVRGIGIRRYGNALTQYAVFRFDGNNNVAGGLMEHVVIEDVAGQATSSNQCHGNTFRHVTVRRAGYGGMAAHRSDNLTYDGVLVEFTNTENFNSSPDSGAAKITQSQHITIKNSIFRDNKCKGVWFDMSVYDMNVINNDFLRNKDTNVFFEISGTGVCANNLFADSPAEAIKVNNTDNMRVWNNTIVRCADLSQRLNPDTSNLSNGDRRPLAVYQETRRPANTSYGLDGRYPLSDPMYTTYMTWVIGNLDIYNNIVASTPANASPLDAAYAVTPGYASLHTTAAGLPSDIAALVGQSTGAKHAGCWR